MLLFVIGLRFGPLGVAAAYSAALYILIVPALWYAGRPIHLKVSSIISVVWKPFVSALVAGLSSWLVMNAYHLTAGSLIQYNALVRIFNIFCCCVFLFILVLVIALHRSIKPISQLSHLLRDMIPRIPHVLDSGGYRKNLRLIWDARSATDEGNVSAHSCAQYPSGGIANEH